jgi:hypothetical protein
MLNSSGAGNLLSLLAILFDFAWWLCRRAKSNKMSSNMPFNQG